MIDPTAQLDYEEHEEAMAEDRKNRGLRMYIALQILRAWNHGTAGHSALVVETVNGWIDRGMKTAVPWPESPFFAEWATQKGYSKIGRYVGFRVTATLCS